jgi:hypothetical protein
MADDQTRRLGKDPSTLFLAGAFAAPLILPCLWISFAANLGAVALGGVALAVLLLIQVSMATAYGRSISHWKISAFNIAHRRRLGAGKDPGSVDVPVPDFAAGLGRDVAGTSHAHS